MGTEATIHGFHSSFRDWVAKTTRYPRELAEVALAHAVGNATEAAYQRGEMLEKRRAMMATWEMHLLTYQQHSGSVTQIGKVAGK
jgi:integrase